MTDDASDPGDPFAVLGLGARPLPDPDRVRTAYFRLAAGCHPDKPGGDAALFSQLTRARDTVLSHPRRLRFLANGAPGGPPPEAHFSMVASALGSSREARKAAARASSALARALESSKLAAARAALAACRSNLEAALASCEERLKVLDAAWPRVEPAALAALATDFAFLERWLDEVREELFQAGVAGTPL